MSHCVEALERGGANACLTNEGAKFDQKLVNEEASDVEVRRIVGKVDKRLIIICGLMIATSLLDRANLSNANIAGMSEDLELSVGSRYSITVLIFFVPYILAEVPLAALIRRVGPRWSLPGINVAWGILIVGFGFVQDWTVLAGLRVLLGVLEAGLIPGLVYLMSLWYTRYEIHKRYSLQYFIGSAGASLGGVLAYAFMQMDGLGGLAAWRWIFIMEGLLTVVVGVLAFLFLIDYPQNAHNVRGFLTEEESTILLQRIEKDRGDSDDDQEFEWAKFLRPALDLNVWCYGFLYNFSTITAYAVAYFLPIILNDELGYSIGVSQVLTTPPYVFAGVVMCIEGWLCDRFRVRSPVLLFNSIQTIVGLCLLAWTKIAGVQYFGVFLVTAGCNSNIPAVMSWQANNIRGHWTRTFCSALLVAMGGLGGVIGALVFRSQDAPQYLPGIYTSILANALIIAMATAMTFHFHRVNKQVSAGEKTIANLPGFTYTL